MCWWSWSAGATNCHSTSQCSSSGKSSTRALGHFLRVGVSAVCPPAVSLDPQVGGHGQQLPPTSNLLRVSWRNIQKCSTMDMSCNMSTFKSWELYGIMGNVKSTFKVKGIATFPNSSSAFFCASSTAFRSTRPTGSATTGTGAGAVGGRAKWAAWTSHPIPILLYKIVPFIANVLVEIRQITHLLIIRDSFCSWWPHGTHDNAVICVRYLACGRRNQFEWLQSRRQQQQNLI